MFKKLVFSFLFLFVSNIISINAQDFREIVIQHLESKNCSAAAAILEKSSKLNHETSGIWFKIGLCQFQSGRFNHAEISFRQALVYDAKNPDLLSKLAYIYLLRDQRSRAKSFSFLTLQVEPTNDLANYVEAVLAFREGDFAKSYKMTNEILARNPTETEYLRLKFEIIVNKIIIQAKAEPEVVLPQCELWKEANSTITEYIRLSPKTNDLAFALESLKAISHFSEYYSTQPFGSLKEKSSKPVETDVIRLKIISKDGMHFTDIARNAGVSGSIKLLANFTAEGKVKDILIIKSLGFGLDEEAIKATRSITFEPQTKNGKPISVAKMLEYHFAFY